MSAVTVVRLPLAPGVVVHEPVDLPAVNTLLAHHHYLGPVSKCDFAFGTWRDDTLVAAQVWSHPTSRYLPADGTWLELSRWVITPAAGPNAGSTQHGRLVRWLRATRPQVTTLVSYSDPSRGHTGALYRACNWRWAPTWHRLRPPPSGNGSWRDGVQQSVKDRWYFPLRNDPRRRTVLVVDEDQPTAMARWEAEHGPIPPII